MRTLIMVCLGVLLVPNVSTAEPVSEMPGPVLRVGVHVSPPFVMKDSDGNFYGIAVDIWREVARGMGQAYRFKDYQSLRTLLADCATGDIDVAVSNVTVTEKRAASMVFTYPWHESGMRLMVRRDFEPTVWEELSQDGRARTLAYFLVLVMSVTVGLTMLRRRLDANFPKRWIEGLSLSFYDLVYAARSGSISPKMFGWVGNILAAVWLLFGVTLIALITSTITATMTTNKLNARQVIETLNDMSNRTLGVLENSAAEEVAIEGNLTYRTYEIAEQAARALAQGEIDAWLHDAPVMDYWLVQNPEHADALQVVGKPLRAENYAFATEPGRMTLAYRISYHLIRLFEDGKLEEIKSGYLGSDG